MTRLGLGHAYVHYLVCRYFDHLRHPPIHSYLPGGEREEVDLKRAPPYARTGLGSIGEMAAYWKVTPISRAMT